MFGEVRSKQEMNTQADMLVLLKYKSVEVFGNMLPIPETLLGTRFVTHKAFKKPKHPKTFSAKLQNTLSTAVKTSLLDRSPQ